MFSEVLNYLLILFAVYGLVNAAGILSERSGIVNIGLNGNVIAGVLGSLVFHGALGYGTKGTEASFGIDIVSLLGSALFGLVVSMIFSIATITLKGDHVIVGTALNILMPIVAFIVLYLDAQGSANFTVAGKDVGRSSSVFIEKVSGAFDWRVIIYALIALVLIVAVWFTLRYTKLGLRMWASGENPHALAAAGVNVHRTRYFAQMIVGVLSGIAGGILLRFYSGSFTYGSFGVDGIGFLAIAMIVVAQWRIHWGILVVVLFSTVQAILMAYQVEIVSLVGAKEFFEVIPFVLPLIVLPLFNQFKKVSNMPKHDGLIYDAGQR